MGLRRRWSARKRGWGDSSAERNLHAQCAALDEAVQDESIIDLAALERERLFATHPRARQQQHRSRPR